MIKFTYLRIKIVLLFVLLIICNFRIAAQSRFNFANNLMYENDYFRAISIYKELAFFSKNNDSTIYYYSQIGKAYRLSQKYDFSILTYSKILNNFKLTDSITSSIYIDLGLNYLGMNVPAQAIYYFKEAQKINNNQFSYFYLGLASVETSDWSSARLYYDQTSKNFPNTNIGILSTTFSKRIEAIDKIPRKSPFLASLMSIIIPGSGQFYSGHYVDAFQAFAFVATFSFATYIAYKNDKTTSSNYILTGISLSITGLFHLANIIGAERTATYYNQRQKELFINELKEQSYKNEK